MSAMFRICPFVLLLVWIGLTFGPAGPARAAESGGDANVEVGLARVDITPHTPVRLSGYAVRKEPFEGIDTPLYVRCLAIRTADGQQRALVAVETIGLPARLVSEVAAAVEQRHRIARHHFVVCSTHTHTAPHIDGALTNLFREPLSEAEQTTLEEYAAQVKRGILVATERALADLRPGRLLYGEGSAAVAINRRVLKDGRWTGFGETPDGVVDHRVGVLRIEDAAGKLRGVVFNYACHCTTLGPDFNQVCGDWAGDASRLLEQAPDVVALCTIGCGADANPVSRGTRDMARQHGQTLALEVRQVLGDAMEPLPPPSQAAFGYAPIAYDLPTREELQARLDDKDGPTRRHAQAMLKILEERKRLPANYPMPIQTWKFGDALAMVFLGGEVVAEYGLRLSERLAPMPVWTSAYANDVFGYVASERMRDEGGYEVDYSMIYYNQPGRWASGTEQRILDRVEQLLESQGSHGARQPEEALQSFRLADGWKIQLAAAEPLIADPVAIAFDASGQLWVVEMGDYPLGIGDAAAAGGRVRRLRDTDGDGRFDDAILFAEGLTFPTGVIPWRDGVLVSAAPNILYLADRDGDGQAEHRQVLYSGLGEGNPQHRANGFVVGLDGWLYLASGDGTRQVRSHLTDETVDVNEQDIAIHPASGAVRPVGGRTQHGRYRNDWGDWFGGNNSYPLWWYPLDDRFQNNAAQLSLPGGRVDLMGAAPPVFGNTDSSARFNDLHAAGRFTSACSHAPLRDRRLRAAMLQTDANAAEWRTDVALVCEPVHNLVHRTLIEAAGFSLKSRRHPQDAASEWLASSDPWFRPVQAVAGPDGAIWVVDMYRAVIEHPEWIPEQWQAQLDLRAGADRGRIWRVIPAADDTRPAAPAAIPVDVVEQIQSPSGAVRDFSLLASAAGTEAEIDRIGQLAAAADEPQTRLHALALLRHSGSLDPQTLQQALQDPHPGVIRFALQSIPPSPQLDPPLASIVLVLTRHDDPAVRMHATCTVGMMATTGDTQPSREVIDALVDRILADGQAPLMQAAVVSAAEGRSAAILQSLSKRAAGHALWIDGGDSDRLLQSLMTLAIGQQPEVTEQWIAAVAQSPEAAAWQVAVVARWAIAVGKRDDVPTAVQAVLQDCIARGSKPGASLEDQLTAVRLIASGYGDGNRAADQLSGFLRAVWPPQVQVAAMTGLCRLPGDVSPLLIDGLSDWSPQLQTIAVDHLLQRTEGTLQLLTAVEQGEVPTGLLSTEQRDRLCSHGNKSIRVRSLRLFGEPPRARQAVLREYDAALALQADPQRGREVFRKSCATCHRIDGEGFELGPELAALKHREPRWLLEAILDPNAAIEAKFRQVQLLTADGRLLTGLLTDQDQQSVQLTRPGGLADRIPRSEIESLRATAASLMPEGLERELTPQMIADVIALLKAP